MRLHMPKTLHFLVVTVLVKYCVMTTFNPLLQSLRLVVNKMLSFCLQSQRVAVCHQLKDSVSKTAEEQKCGDSKEREAQMLM